MSAAAGNVALARYHPPTGRRARGGIASSSSDIVVLRYDADGSPATGTRAPAPQTPGPAQPTRSSPL
jgi:hypothetical protein